MKYIISLFVCFVTLQAFAKPNLSNAAKLLYPSNVDDQNFMIKLFEIIEIHKTKDPLFEGKGPSVSFFSLDKQLIAFIINEKETTVDLVFLNWNLPLFQGLNEYPALSKALNSKTYILRNVDKKSIATQGENDNELANFSYINGANFMEKQIKVDMPDMVIPDKYLNWKPHPLYMDKEHPLRQALDGLSLTVLSPSKTKFSVVYGESLVMKEIVEKELISQGGYLNVVLGMMVHEAFHVHEGNEKVIQSVSRRTVDIDRKKLIEQLKHNDDLKSLYMAYISTVFRLGDSLKNQQDNTEVQLLADLSFLIGKLKSKFPNAWSYIWDLEYTEGFAEYVSAQSIVAVNVTSLAQQINLQKKDPSNNFTYRTGAIGGLHLYYRIGSMPFSKNETLNMSVWEIIIQKHRAIISNTAPNSMMKILSQSSSLDLDDEIQRVIEYLEEDEVI